MNNSHVIGGCPGRVWVETGPWGRVPTPKERNAAGSPQWKWSPNLLHDVYNTG